jgi:hypothetical protein
MAPYPQQVNDRLKGHAHAGGNTCDKAVRELMP